MVRLQWPTCGSVIACRSAVVTGCRNHRWAYLFFPFIDQQRYYYIIIIKCFVVLLSVFLPNNFFWQNHTRIIIKILTESLDVSIWHEHLPRMINRLGKWLMDLPGRPSKAWKLLPDLAVVRRRVYQIRPQLEVWRRGGSSDRDPILYNGLTASINRTCNIHHTCPQ